MVYKKYIKRGNKVFGPYYYESYRDGDKVKTRFISGPRKEDIIARKTEKIKKTNKKFYKLPYKNLFLILGIISIIFLLLLIGNLNYNLRITEKITGKVAYDEEIVSSSDVKIAEKIARRELVSNVDVRKHVDLNIKEPVFERNRIMEFDVPEGKIILEFNLLNYSRFVEKKTEEEIEAENFDINVQESAEKYKWGYDIRLRDLNFMAKIDIEAENIIIIDDQTLKIGKNYISFADLAEQGYILSINKPVVLEEVNISVNITEVNMTEVNISEINVTNITEINITDINITIPEENITEIIENITEINVTEEVNVTIEENITEEIIEINETIEEVEESNITKEEILEGTDKAEEEIVEQLEEEQEAEEEIEEQQREAEEEFEEELAEITGEIIRGLTGFFINGAKGMTGLVAQEQENIVSIYIQKDFTNSSYGVGDTINLDPILIRIEITKAIHLDENRTFMSDIYGQVKEKDDIWSELIPTGHYARVTFEQNLTKDKDITIYARSADNESAEIEVYRQDDDEIITIFENILEENWYKVYLSNLSENESYDVFDLKIKNAGVEFDYVVDPQANESDTVYRCGTLDSPGTYTMNQSIINDTLTGDCIVINTQNVTLDCAGYYISSDDNVSGIYSNSYNTTIKNCNISMGNESGGYGIRFGGATFGYADYSYVYNCTLNNQYSGISSSSLVNQNDNLKIEKVTANNNSVTGISIDGANSNLTDIIVNNNTNDGIYLFKSSGNNLINITANSNGDNGIKSAGTGNALHVLTNITVNSNGDNGIWSDGTGHVLTGITANLNAGDGIDLVMGSSNSLTSITVSNNSGFGIHLNSNNNLTDATAINNSVAGIGFSGSNNTLTNSTAISNLIGIGLSSGSNNVITNIKAESNDYAISIYVSSNNNITNVNISSSLTYDVFLDTTSTNNIFLNVSYDESKEHVGSGCELIRKGYVNYIYANVTYYGNDSIISGANVTLRNFTNSVLLSNLSDATGLTTLEFASQQLLTFYKNTGTKTQHIWLSTTKGDYLTEVTNFNWDTLLVNKADIDSSITNVPMHYSTYTISISQTLDDIYNSINNEDIFTNASLGTDCHYIANTSLDVVDGGQLTIEGCVLEFAPVSGGYRSFSIQNGGILIMNYSNITAYNRNLANNYNFYSLSGSTLTLKNSYIDYTGTADSDLQRGLEINSSSLLFDNITMSNNVRALTLLAPDLTIQNSKISGSYDSSLGDNVRIANYGARIINSAISNPSAGLSNIIINTNMNVTVVNSTYEDDVAFYSGAKLFKKWFYVAYVNNTANQNLSNTNISAYNYLNELDFNLTTDSTGYTGLGEITEYVENSATKTYYTNHTIYASKNIYCTSNHTYNISITKNNFKDVFTLTLGCVSGCGILDQADTVYTQTADIIQTSNAKCIIISAQNITLDCKGYSITSIYNEIGIYSNQINTTIKNCNISMGSSSPGHGIEFDNADDGYILNNTAGYQWIGIYIKSGSNNNVIENNTASSNSKTGISIVLSSNNNLTNNTASLNDGGGLNGDGIYIGGGSNNSLINNTCNNNKMRGIYVVNSDSLNNQIINNTANDNGEHGFHSNQASRNTLKGNTFYSNGITEEDYGIYLFISSNNSITNNNVTGNTDHGIRLEGGNNNNITGNTVRENGYNAYGDGINIKDGDNNVIDSNIVSDNYDDGVRLKDTSQGNNISNNNITGNADKGINLGELVGNTVDYNIIINNNISNNLDDGIKLDLGSDYNNITGNTINNNGNCTAETGDGIEIGGGDYNRIVNNIINNNCDDGFELDNAATDNIVINNTINLNHGDGIHIENSSVRNRIENCTISSNLDEGIQIENSSSHNIIIGNFVNINNDHGIKITTSAINNTIQDNIINGSGRNPEDTGDGINIQANSNIIYRNNITNGADDGIKLNGVTGNNITGNLMDMDSIDSNVDKGIHIINSSNNDFYENSVNLHSHGFYLHDVSTGNTFVGNTATNNSLQGFYVKAALDTGNTFTNPYACCNYGDYDIYDLGSSTFMNTTCSSFNNGADSSCDNACLVNCSAGCNYEISSSYTMTNNTDCINTAFLINADNMVFDCDGFSISGPNKNSHSGIYVGARTNVTIKNCFISNFKQGIYFDNTQNSSILDNELRISNAGIRFRFALKNTIFNNNITGNDDGIELESSSNNNISNNFIDSNYDDGIQVELISSHNVISWNNITNNLDKGIKFETSSINNTLSNNTLSNNGRDILVEADSLAQNDFVNMSFEVRDLLYGGIVWNSPLTFSYGDLSEVISISYNSIFVDSSKIPALNASANITVYNTDSFGFYGYSRHALRDGTVCPFSICTTITNADTYVFGVTQFTTYSISGTLIPGAVPPGGGGGAGCTPDWVCSAWSACADGVQTRTCIDFNDCRTSFGKPDEEQSCAVPSGEEEKPVEEELPTTKIGAAGCISNWQCVEWSKCKAVYNLDIVVEGKVLLKGEQTRLCGDLSNCAYDKTEKQECDTKIPIIAKKVVRCFKDYLEVYDKTGVLISRLELVEGVYKKLNIQMLFDETGYCPYCFDEQKNYDEEEIDCVYEEDGNCPVCGAELPVLRGNYLLMIIILIVFGILTLLSAIWYLILLRKSKKRKKKIIKMSKL